MNTTFRLLRTKAAISLAAISIAWPIRSLAAEPLTFTAAVEQAVQLSPDVEARAAERQAAEALIRPAGQLPDPELILGVDNLPITGAEAGSFTRDFMTMRKVGVMQSFPRQSKRAIRTQRAVEAEHLALAEQSSTTLDVKRQAAQAWISTYFAEQTLIQLRQVETELKLQAELADAGVKSGRTTVADAYESHAALLSIRDRILVAEQSVRNARAELARWLPNHADRPLAESPVFTQLPKAEILDNIHHHASLVAYDAQLDVARAEVSLAEAEKRPDWSVGMMYAKRGPDFSDMVSLEVRVGLPLFASRRQDPVIASKRAELRKVSAQREAELRMHTAQISQMIADWEILLKRREVFNSELLPLAEERRRLALGALQAGRGDVKAVLTAQINHAELRLRSLEIEAMLGKTWAFLSYLQDERRAQ